MLTTQSAATTATAQQRPAAGTKRDPWFDNAKFVLVTLVVIGHAWMLLPHHGVVGAAYTTLYLFHIPAFVMVTGYLSRSARWDRRSLSRIVTTLVVPYFVFTAAMGWFRDVVGGEHVDLVTLDPNWPMWYLAVLAVWRLLTPVFLKTPKAVLVAVAVSLLGGLTSGDTLDLARAMGLLPFFMVGLHARREHLDLLRGPRARLTAGIVLATSVVLGAVLSTQLDREWLYWRSSYGELGVSVVDGMAIRLGMLGLGLVLAVAALALIPQRRSWYTPMGAASLVIYLFHGFVIKAASYVDVYGLAESTPSDLFVATTLGSVGIALLLGRPGVAGALGRLADPVGTLRRWATG